MIKIAYHSPESEYILIETDYYYVTLMKLTVGDSYRASAIDKRDGYLEWEADYSPAKYSFTEALDDFLTKYCQEKGFQDGFESYSHWGLFATDYNTDSDVIK